MYTVPVPGYRMLLKGEKVHNSYTYMLITSFCRNLLRTFFQLILNKHQILLCCHPYQNVFRINSLFKFWFRTSQLLKSFLPNEHCTVHSLPFRWPPAVQLWKIWASPSAPSSPYPGSSPSSLAAHSSRQETVHLSLLFVAVLRIRIRRIRMYVFGPPGSGYGPISQR